MDVESCLELRRDGQEAFGDRGDLRRCILRSRRRNGWCEFSARLFMRKPARGEPTIRFRTCRATRISRFGRRERAMRRFRKLDDRFQKFGSILRSRSTIISIRTLASRHSAGLQAEMLCCIGGVAGACGVGSRAARGCVQAAGATAVALTSPVAGPKAKSLVMAGSAAMIAVLFWPTARMVSDNTRPARRASGRAPVQQTEIDVFCYYS